MESAAHADGKPDLQGVWSNNSVTPMTRPTQWKSKEFLTDAEVQELRGRSRATQQAGDAIFGDIVQLALNVRDTGKFDQTSYDPTTGNYNQFWMAERDWDNRTSLITDPPNGQMPPLTADRPARLAADGARPRRWSSKARRRARGAVLMARKIGRSQSAAFRTACRARGRDTTATSRSCSRLRRW